MDAVKRRSLISLGILVVLLAGSLIVWLVLKPVGPRAMKLKVTGSPGVLVSATMEADGRVFHETSTVPCEFDVTAEKLTFSIKPANGDAGEIRVEMLAEGRLHGTTGSLKGVSGRLEFDGRKLKDASISGL